MRSAALKNGYVAWRGSSARRGDEVVGVLVERERRDRDQVHRRVDTRQRAPASDTGRIVAGVRPDPAPRAGARRELNLRHIGAAVPAVVAVALVVTD